MKRTILVVLRKGLVGLLCSLLFAFPWQWMWNVMLAPLAKFPQATWTQVFVILFLLQVLTMNTEEDKAP